MGSLDVRSFGFNGLADLLVNPCDVAFSIRDVVRLADQAGLRVIGQVNPELYKPAGPPALLRDLEVLPWVDQAAFAELQRGNILTHHVWLVRKENHVQSRDAVPWDKESVLCFADWMPAPNNFMPPSAIQRGLEDQSTVFEAAMGAQTQTREDVEARGGLPALGPAILSRTNCRRTLEEIFLLVAEAAEWHVTWDEFLEHAWAWQQSLESGRAVLHVIRESAGNSQHNEL